MPTAIAGGGALLIDAREGLAFPACELAVAEAVAAARTQGVAFAGVVNSHHCGVVVDHLRPAAAAGMVGLGFSNSPAAMPAAGGRHAIFGTNPVAAVFPRRQRPDAPAGACDPLLIELGQVAVNLVVNAQAALAGSMLPLGAVSSPKGAMLALMVELLVTAVIGANFGFEAGSFFVDEGNRPHLGQVFVIIDPGALAGNDAYLDRPPAALRRH